MTSYHEELLTLAAFAKRDPSLLSNHCLHNVPASLRELQAELVEIIELMDADPARSEWRECAVSDLQRITDALKVYEPAPVANLLEVKGSTS